MPVRIIVRPDGTKKVEAEGHIGPSCSTATQPFLKDVEVLEDIPKPEYYAEPQSNDEQQETGN